MNMYERSVFIFRRDLRFADNTGLYQALQNSRVVLACFILDPRQVQPHEYRSEYGLQFMLESLNDLNLQLQEQGGRLLLFYGNPLEVLRNLKQEFDYQAVYFNADYTPFSISRDQEVAEFCKKIKIEYKSLVL